MAKISITTEQREWLAGQIEALTSEVENVLPSQWAEKHRYLPAQVTPFPGYFRFSVTPYLREIVDCFDPESPVREVALLKGAQIAGTVGVLENVIGYSIAHLKTSPVMLVTADAELANLRLESYILPMLEHSGLSHLIASSDNGNNRKTGKTKAKVEWQGGGFLLPLGARNAAKFRSASVQILLLDELDAFPDPPDDGDPVALLKSRTQAYDASRKILSLSTPKLKGTSRITSQYLRGDQRKYHVACLRCNHLQEFRWTRTNPETGEITGFTWDLTPSGRLIQGSVRYLCEACSHPHTDADKAKLLSPEYGARWVPTAEPVAPDIRSYHLPALYAAPGMLSWASCAQAWLDAWDAKENRPKDQAKLQVFYNNFLGVAFELRGNPIKTETLTAHRRAYSFGEIPNRFALEHCTSTILLLTCTVDVQKDYLSVAVFGWAVDQRCFVIEYREFEGDTEQLESPCWTSLSELLEDGRWTADDGKVYGITLTLVDSGFQTDTVYRFCRQYEAGVIPIKGVASSQRSARVPEFTESRLPSGQYVYGITVDLFKDRWSAALRRNWDGQSTQPYGHFNCPQNTTDRQLKELNSETRREKRDAVTNRLLGYVWHRPSGSRNELWDLLVYASASVELLAWNMAQERGLEQTDWHMFWDACQREQLFFTTS